MDLSGKRLPLLVFADSENPDGETLAPGVTFLRALEISLSNALSADLGILCSLLLDRAFTCDGARLREQLCSSSLSFAAKSNTCGAFPRVMGVPLRLGAMDGNGLDADDEDAEGVGRDGGSFTTFQPEPSERPELETSALHEEMGCSMETSATGV